MNIYSMTGFGKGETTTDAYTLSVEIKSVNNRFKDYRFKMGSIFNSEELNLKKAFDTNIKRGSFDIYVNYKRAEGVSKAAELDEAKIRTFVNFMKETIGDALTLNLSATSFLRNEFFKDEDSSTKFDELSPMLMTSFNQALSNLKISREEEGSKLVDKIKEHLETYRENYLGVIPLKSKYREQIEDKLRKKLTEKLSDLSIDDNRFTQEVIYYLEKFDIDEEISRIDVHLARFDKLIAEGGEVGRKIDFLVQELNRETNTIGSKSAHDKISVFVVEMKVNLEKIREQALNLE
jgi:uncharacterized protein (TIGR00255 family)